MLRRSGPLVLLAALAALSFSACDTDVSQDDDVEPDLAEVSPGIAALYAGDNPGEIETAEGACFSDALLDRVSLEDLQVSGLVQDNGAVAQVAPMLDVDLAEAWVEAQETCVSFVEVSTRALASQSKGKVDQTAYAECLTGAISAEEIHVALVKTLSGGFDSPEVDRLGQAQADCARGAQPSD